MLTREDLDGAVAAGILDAGQADALVRHLAAPVEADLEEVRFARGFHDIFISIGLVILFAGLFVAFAGLDTLGSPVLPAFGTAAVLAWGLAEWLSRRRRLALPSILLAGLFTWFTAIAGAALYVGAPAAGGRGLFQSLVGPAWGLLQTPEGGIACGVAAFAGAAAFYARFSVPITLTGLVIGAILVALSALEAIAPGLVETQFATLMLIAGLAAFALAMHFDSRDVRRATLNTDKAFWLHLLAAPLIMHSTLSMVPSETASTGSAVLIIAIVLLLGLVALTVDRRALLVSGLAYLGVAIANLLRTSDVASETALAVTLLLLGLFVLTLGSGWSAARRLLLKPFADTALFTFVPAIRTRTQ